MIIPQSLLPQQGIFKFTYREKLTAYRLLKRFVPTQILFKICDVLEVGGLGICIGHDSVIEQIVLVFAGQWSQLSESRIIRLQAGSAPLDHQGFESYDWALTGLGSACKRIVQPAGLMGMMTASPFLIRWVELAQ